MKKIFALAMSALMLLSMTACEDGREKPSTASDPKSAVSVQETQSQDEGDGGGKSGKLSVWCWDPAFNIYAMKEAEKVYQKENPDFELEVIETPWDDLQTKLTTAATSGDLATLPDIFLCQNNAFQKNVMNYPDIFIDLKDSGIDFNEFPQSVVDYSVIEGVNYGLPFDNGTAVSAYRVDMLEEAGLTVEDFTDITWDEYIEKGKQVLEKTGKPMMAATAGSSDMMMMMMQSCGASLFNSDGTLNIVGNTELKEVFETYKKLMDSGVLVEVNSWDELVTSFVGGNVAGTMNGCWILASVQTADDQSGKWAITNFPKLSNSAATNYTANGGSSWAISSNCQNPALAKDFLNKTFGSSVELFETILPTSGAIANYFPAGDSTVYADPQEFFGGDSIYSKIVDYSSKVPSNNTGVYYYEARDAVGTAMTKVIQGTALDNAIKEAEDTVNFAMGK